METTQSTSNGRHVVVVGGSFAGLGAAYTVRERLGPADRVTLVSDLGHFVFAPSLVRVALGQRLPHSSFELDSALAAKGVDFVRSHVREVRADAHTVVTDSGEMRYDRLVIATGGRPDTSAIPGLAGEFRAASWIVGEDSAMEARNAVRALLADPGPLVIGAAQGASYISAAYELALGLDAMLRREGRREQVPITFVTAEPYLGHLGFGQTAARPKIEKLFAERNIEPRVGVGIDHLSRHEVALSGGEPFPAKTSIIMPPFTGAVDIWKSAQLTDQSGLIPVTPQYRHVEHPDIYAAGVASYFAEPVPPLGYGRPPHTGYLSLHSGRITGQNVAASLGSGQPASRALPYYYSVSYVGGGSV